MAKPRETRYAVPLPQSSRSSILEYRFPAPFSQYTLVGRSRAAWHTSFIIPQLDLLLDAGLCVNHLRPKHIFITHGHNDHTLLTPAFVKREDPPDIYCPVAVESVLDNFILANTMLNLGGDIGLEEAEEMIQAERDSQHVTNGWSNKSSSKMALLNTHHAYGLEPGAVVSLRRSKGIEATAFACDHSVPCLGYVFSSITHRLKPEFAHLKGPELRDLRLSGAAITAPHSTNIFAFLGDTTAATLASEPGWLKNGVAVVITECSFLWEEHRPQAERTKHTIWGDLEPVVRRWPATTFVLTHFSLRYSDAMVVDFFQNLKDCPSNIVIWADEEAALM